MLGSLEENFPGKGGGGGGIKIGSYVHRYFSIFQSSARLQNYVFLSGVYIY